MLREVRDLLLAGEVVRARRTLEALWEEPLPSSEREIITFTREAVFLASIYRWHSRSLAWLEQARAALDPHASQASKMFADTCLRALRACLFHSEHEGDSAQEFFTWFLPHAEVDPSLWTPWIYNYYLQHLFRRLRLDDFDTMLKRPPLKNREFSPWDRCARLVHYGHRLASELRYTQASRVFEAAERRLLELPRTPEREYLLSVCLTYRARICAFENKPHQARQLLNEAERFGVAVHAPAALGISQLTLGHILKESGEYTAAIESYLEAVPARSSETHALASNGSYAYIFAARCAILGNKLSRAAHYLEAARPYVIDSRMPRLQAFHHVVCAHLEINRKTPSGYTQAHEHLENAATMIETHGWHNTPLHLLLLLGKGWLALGKGQATAALQHGLHAHQLAQDRQISRLEAETLYLQSALLLESTTPKSRLYDRTLSRLGAIKDPQLLFKVVANLYLYTWELTGDIELSDLHLKQLTKIRHCLSEEQFRVLYDEHIKRPVFKRLWNQMMESG